ncbi:MAG TPA: Xaa-Pro peptidase family protein, partial [Anaerolineales bacterium]|nr:Xaa-Pro peptidase family protein [Anaerolineales bacterium]
GAGPFLGGPPLVWYDAAEGFTLIVTDFYDPAGLSLPVVHYPGYTVDVPVSSTDNLAKIIGAFVGRQPSAAKLGADMRRLPAFLLPSEANVIAIDGWLDPLRMIKTAEEIETLRRAFALTDLAHAAARRATEVGAREIDVWSIAHSAAQGAAGYPVLLGNDCVASYRDNNIGGLPGDLPLRPGDSVMVDLSIRLDGYWSDSCATYYATEPNARQRAMHLAAAQALDLAISLVKPGVRANEIDRQVREFIAAAGYPVYPHHTGHGIGVSTHEEPRIVPYNSTALEPGMVIMLEPGIYFPKEAAVRLEDAVLVTADGAEVLTRHDKSLPA